MDAEGFEVAVIGGGVAGSAVTLALAARAPAGYRLALFDRAEPGPGTAYAPQSPSLLLNGPVRAMSPVPGDPGHFQRYLVDEPEDALVCRARYGTYVKATVASALASRRDFHAFVSEVTDVDSEGEWYRVTTRDGSSILARNVVLALGNFAPGDSALPAELRAFPGYARDPWRVDVSQFAGNVALIGSRLTAMDVVALLDESAFRGRVHLISRHGLLPLVENPRIRGLDPAPLALDSSTPRALLRALRRAANSHPGDWRAVVDSIRASTPAIWASWSTRDRRRFLRHAHSIWAIHRYRVPAATHAAFGRLHAAGRIENHRGRVTSARIEGDALRLGVTSGAKTYELGVDHVVNCTGPEANIERVEDPLVRGALERGLIHGDVLKLGVDTSPRLRVLDHGGREQEHLFAMGPLVRGLWFETTAIPEITKHAQVVVEALLAQRATHVSENVG